MALRHHRSAVATTTTTAAVRTNANMSSVVRAAWGFAIIQSSLQCPPPACASGRPAHKKREADRLVDSTLDLLNEIWAPVSSAEAGPPSPPASSAGSSSSDESDDDEGGVSLRTFVNEILRRSRSSCVTLRAAKGYLERAAVLLPPWEADRRKGSLACPRRTFLSALVLAHKFLHDRVYSNRAWGKVSGLEVREISLGETALGSLLGWALWVKDDPVPLSLPASPPPSPVLAPATLHPAPPPLVPLRQTRSWQPKRPLGPGRGDQAFARRLTGGAPVGVPTIVLPAPRAELPPPPAAAAAAAAGEGRGRPFEADAEADDDDDERQERAPKRARMGEHAQQDEARGFVAAGEGTAGSLHASSGEETALAGGASDWERRMRELLVV